MMVYKIDKPDPDPNNLRQQYLAGSCHNNEYQGDVKLTFVLNKTDMSNVVVFVVRYYGGIQLGGNHLKHIADCGRKALNTLRFPDGVPPADNTTDPSSSQQDSTGGCPCSHAGHGGHGGPFRSYVQAFKKRPKYDANVFMGYTTATT